MTLEESTWEVISTRRAIRDFDLSKKVPDDLLHKIINAGCQAPSPENYQPWRFVVIKDEKKKRFIADRAIGACLRTFGTQIPRTEVERRFWYMVEKEERPLDKFYRVETSLEVMADGWRMEYIGESPVLIAVVIDSSLLTEDFRMPIVGTWAGGGQTEPMAYICAGLAIMNMWLMASSLGLGMCCHNFELTDPQDEGDIASLLGVPYPRWRIAAILSLGYPSGERVLGPKRHPPEEVTYSEKYGEPYRFER